MLVILETSQTENCITVKIKFSLASLRISPVLVWTHVALAAPCVRMLTLLIDT